MPCDILMESEMSCMLTTTIKSRKPEQNREKCKSEHVKIKKKCYGKDLTAFPGGQKKNKIQSITFKESKGFSSIQT